MLASSHGYTNATSFCTLIKQNGEISDQQISEAVFQADKFTKTNLVDFTDRNRTEQNIILPYSLKFKQQ